MKVTFCAYDRPQHFGGPNIWLRRLLPDLQRQGVAVEALFITRGSPEMCPTFTFLQSRGVACHATQTLVYTERHVQWLLRELRRRPPDIFVANLVTPALYAARWLTNAGIPVVGVIHSDDDFYAAVVEEFMRGRSGLPPIRAAVCVSSYIAERVRARTPAGVSVHTIPCGAPVPDAAACWAGGPLRLIYAGRLTEKGKHISALTQALCAAARTIPGVEACMYGDGPDRPAVEAILAEHGAGLPVSLQGAVDSEALGDCLLRGHVFVLLSEYEGLPISLMEAMACGLVPVCLTMKSGIPEIIRHGENGYIVSDRRDSFLSAIRALAGSRALWDRLSRAARETVTERYSQNSCNRQWLEMLQDLKPASATRNSFRIPRRVKLPPVHPDLAREDRRQPLIIDRILRAIRPAAGHAKHIVKGIVKRHLP